MTKKPLVIKASEMQLGDVVRMTGNYRPFDTCIVTKIKDDRVELFRPYGHTADFSYTGGVIPYIGIEQYHIWLSDSTEYELFERKILR